jgi:hypothetical protein
MTAADRQERIEEIAELATTRQQIRFVKLLAGVLRPVRNMPDPAGRD